MIKPENNIIMCGLSAFLNTRDEILIAELVFQTCIKELVTQKLNKYVSLDFDGDDDFINKHTIYELVKYEINKLIEFNFSDIVKNFEINKPYTSVDFSSKINYQEIQEFNNIIKIWSIEFIIDIFRVIDEKELFLKKVCLICFLRKNNTVDVIMQKNVFFFDIFPENILKIESKNDELRLIDYMFDYMEKINELKNCEKGIIYIDVFYEYLYNETNRNYYKKPINLEFINLRLKIDLYKRKIVQTYKMMPNIERIYVKNTLVLNSRNFFDCEHPEINNCSNLYNLTSQNPSNENKVFYKNAFYVGNNIFAANVNFDLNIVYSQMLNKTLYFSLFRKKLNIVLDHNFAVKNFGNVTNLNAFEKKYIIYRTIFKSIKNHISKLTYHCYCIKEFYDIIEADSDQFCNDYFKYPDLIVDLIYENFLKQKSLDFIYDLEYKELILINHRVFFNKNFNHNEKIGFRFSYKDFMFTAVCKSFYKLTKPYVFDSLEIEKKIFFGINFLSFIRFIHVNDIKIDKNSVYRLNRNIDFDTFIKSAIKNTFDCKNKKLTFFYTFFIEKKNNKMIEVNSKNILEKFKLYLDINLNILLNIEIILFLEFQIIYSDIENITPKITISNQKCDNNKILDKLFDDIKSQINDDIKSQLGNNIQIITVEHFKS
ncbi:hypothetical protein GVAV_001714 [Gurleya vavrai]